MAPQPAEAQTAPEPFFRSHHPARSVCCTVSAVWGMASVPKRSSSTSTAPCTGALSRVVQTTSGQYSRLLCLALKTCSTVSWAIRTTAHTLARRWSPSTARCTARLNSEAPVRVHALGKAIFRVAERSSRCRRKSRGIVTLGPAWGKSSRVMRAF